MNQHHLMKQRFVDLKRISMCIGRTSQYRYHHAFRGHIFDSPCMLCICCQEHQLVCLCPFLTLVDHQARNSDNRMPSICDHRICSFQFVLVCSSTSLQFSPNHHNDDQHLQLHQLLIVDQQRHYQFQLLATHHQEHCRWWSCLGQLQGREVRRRISSF